jgi:hypothetical protein
MIFAVQLDDSDQLIGVLAILVLCSCCLVKLVRWFLGQPTQSDPWSKEIAFEIAAESSIPVCHRCLTPHDPQVDFCPDCGAPVGTYTNFLPYPYLFSIGHTLRIGTNGDFKRSRLTITGFLIFSLVEYAIFAPIYWFIFLKNLSRQSPSYPSVESFSDSASEDPSSK